MQISNLKLPKYIFFRYRCKCIEFKDSPDRCKCRSFRISPKRFFVVADEKEAFGKDLSGEAAGIFGREEYFGGNEVEVVEVGAG